MAVEVAHKCLQNEDTLEKRTVLNIEEIATLHKFCLDSIYICFRGKYYEQTFDTTMGSPVSVVVANLVIEEIEQTALSNFHSMPRLWKRYMYVDDMCATVYTLHKGLIPAFTQHLNVANKHIQSTLEEEQTGNLALLNLLLKRNHDGSMDISVYGKKPHSDKYMYLDFTSYQPLVHTQVVVTTLLEQPRLSSDAVGVH